MRLALPVASAFLAAGCIGAGGRGSDPPRPDRTIRIESVGIAREVRHGPCATVKVTLQSGMTIDVQTQTNLAGCSTRVTPNLLGNLGNTLADVDGKGALVLTGMIDGERWIGSAAWRSSVSAWCVIFAGEEGAFREGDAFHLSSGLMLNMSRGFGWIENRDESEFLPLRSGDDFCLNELGEAIRADVWNGG